ncbi:Transcriptional regulator [Planctomycetes bacterium CA13]|uniref:Transcriptional regulator n=1 Tax=Novipirellula herctigrandis TaxID=2527986 RepID=A0A5C5ZBX4_9BACT|nr:Transcriptional regulator [Planctomycetes bacterium CA13]
MHLRTAGYALRAVTCLAGQTTWVKTPSSVDASAGVTKIPRRYLHRVMQNLANADLVESRCVSRGGYSNAWSTLVTDCE